MVATRRSAQLFLKLGSSILESLQSLLQGRHLALDLAKLRQGVAIGQMIIADLLRDVLLLKLTPQQPEVCPTQRWSPEFGQCVKLDSALTWKDLES